MAANPPTRAASGRHYPIRGNQDCCLLWPRLGCPARLAGSANDPMCGDPRCALAPTRIRERTCTRELAAAAAAAAAAPRSGLLSALILAPLCSTLPTAHGRQTTALDWTVSFGWPELAASSV